MGIFDFLFKKKQQQNTESSSPSGNKWSSPKNTESSSPSNNERLESLLKECALHGTNQDLFYQTLMASDVFTIVADGYEGGEPIPILKLNSTYIPLFTSIDRIMESEQIRTSGINYVGINAASLFQSLNGAPAVLNPFSEYAKEFTPQEVEYLLGNGNLGVSKETIPAGTQMIIGIPEEKPEELVAALQELFSSAPEVKKAFLLMTQKGEEPMHFLIVVDCSGSLETIVNAHSALLNEKCPDGLELDFATFEQLASYKPIFEEIEPFYTK